MQRHASYAKGFVLIGSLVVLAGCSGEPPEVEGCAPENDIRGACAGIPPGATCKGAVSTQGVACMGVTSVTSDAELQAAIGQAMSGQCITLAPGQYGAANLPGGVSLLGKAAACVTVGPVTINGGSGAVVRGLTTSGIHLPANTTGAKIEAVRVVDSADDGVLVKAQSSVAMITSSIEGAGRHGLRAVDALDVSLDRVVIAGSAGPGLWVESSGDCASPAPQKPIITVQSSIVRDNHIAGVALYGAQATIQGLDILKTVPGEKFFTMQGGGGLSIAECSTIDVAGLRVHDSKSFGVFVDNSSGTIGKENVENGDVEVHGNVIGFAIQNLQTDSLTVANADLDANEGVGIGVSGGTKSVIICRTKLSKTTERSLPTVGAGATNVGYGLSWADKATVNTPDLTVNDNALANVLIDGEVFGELGVTAASDTNLGTQQNLMGATPVKVTSSPMQTLQKLQGPMFPVPLLPTVLPETLP